MDKFIINILYCDFQVFQKFHDSRSSLFICAKTTSPHSLHTEVENANFCHFVAREIQDVAASPQLEGLNQVETFEKLQAKTWTIVFRNQTSSLCIDLKESYPSVSLKRNRTNHLYLFKVF